MDHTQKEHNFTQAYRSSQITSWLDRGGDINTTGLSKQGHTLLMVRTIVPYRATRLHIVVCAECHTAWLRRYPPRTRPRYHAYLHPAFCSRVSVFCTAWCMQVHQA